MKFSESVIAKLPKRTIPPQEYQILARSRYHPRYGIERIERINPQEIAHVPEVLQKIGFAAVRNILTESATGKARSATLRNKNLVAALQEAWGRVRPTEVPEEAAISWMGTAPAEGVRFNQPGFHMIIPGDGRVAVRVTQRWRYAQTTVRPGDALAWSQDESFFPCVEMHNAEQRHYVGAFVLHESVAYTSPPVAPLPPPVSQ